MQLHIEDGNRLSKKVLKHVVALDEAKIALRDASYELGYGEETWIATEVMLAAHLCRLASDLLMTQLRALEKDLQRAAEARNATQEVKLEPKPAQEPANPYEGSPRILRCPTTMEPVKPS